MEVYFWDTFIKKDNSTRVPDLGNAYEHECTLKAPSSILTPVIELDNKIEFKNYTYAYIPDFSRYYFITDITATGLIWVYTLNIDVLATYKWRIEYEHLYAVRSSGRFDGYLADNFYPPTGLRVTRSDSAMTPWIHENNTEEINIKEGIFILGIVAEPYSTGAGSYGSIRYYALKQDQLYDLIHYLLNNTIVDGVNGFNAQDATISLQKSLINPLSYIKSCLWFPFLYENIDGMVMSHIKVWDWTIDADCKLLTKNPPYVMYNTLINLTDHPQISRGRYLNLEPYRKVTLRFPPFGMIGLDTTALIDAADIRCQILIDLITGSAIMDIRAGSSAKGYISIAMLKAQVGVSIQLSEIGYDYSNYVASGIGITAEAIKSFMGDMLPMGLSNAITQIGNAANASRTRLSSLGSNGNFSELRGLAYLYQEYFMIPEEDRYHAGRPLCQEIQLINEETGYYIMRDGNLEFTKATYPELEQIRAYLEGGFYYE